MSTLALGRDRSELHIRPATISPALLGVVSAMVYATGPEFMRNDPERAAGFLNRSAADVSRMVAGMPTHLRGPILLLTFLFDFGTIPFHGRRFRQLAPVARRLCLERWRRSRIGPCAQFVRFYDSLIALQLYAQAEVVAWASRTTGRQ